MLTRLAIPALIAMSVLYGTAPASAARLPGIKVAPNNVVPACATPGRLMAFLRSRNTRMNPRYDKIAVSYMRHGEQLGIRWDIAFFQMLVETANLAYTGDVDASQNNFAGLGATGGGVKGERFRDVDSGVRAHLEHVLMYTGETIQNPVAERTRKVQEWNVLTSWQRSIRGPMTFSHLTTKWAPSDRGYSDDIKSIADLFYQGECNRPDPEPQLVALARGGKMTTAAAKTPPATQKPATASSADLVASVINRNRAQAADPSGLGAPPAGGSSNKPAPAATLSPDAPAADAKSVTVLNSPGAKENAPTKTAMVANEAKKAAPAKSEPDKCRVWTASYGGAKAIIIKAVNNDVVNYTVLDVNAGKEKREAEAYIAAYAKGGETLEEFSSASAALDKAFQLCPEG
ncbi:conserved exported protein of unknown function [Candidatus Filomicrobium marinum]|uniref:Uncharacterized protein n=2 Tax=Filomicrobium TaxID=119044 RepID=A0A0D6JAP1_9HYPH|nr:MULTISPECIES: glucosaminidase domain-containing protein [Filomicrobium]CFW98006.1 conserved exported protein of unknown function [Candidatus Filomicrobium marinum]CPR14821.1 conserved exported protein of unknown function [Candidatus Filomicrobium marinum]SDO74896.1 hypothetical protein SAMN04488061_1556 [Filomicrobium insigne]